MAFTEDRRLNRERPAVIVDPREKKVRKSPVLIPVNLTDALATLTLNLTDEKRAEITALDEKEFIGRNHFFLGMSLRNAWGLWTGSPLKDWFVNMGVLHADDMSGILLRSFYRTVLGKEIDLTGQLEDIRQWHAKNPPLPNHKKKNE